MLKVKGKDNLVRDENSRAIINTDSNGLSNARNAKRIAMKRLEREQQLESRIEYLEKALDTILKARNNE